MKKSFFKPIIKSEIKKNNLVNLEGISNITNIMNLREDEFAVVNFYLPKDCQSPKKFMKHEVEVLPKRQYTQKEAMKRKKTPIQLREKAFNSIRSPFFCGYTFTPLGRDKRKRKVSLVDCLEGARIFAYANQKTKKGIIVNPYADAKRVKKEGGEIICNVPSRTSKEERYEFKLMSVPIEDTTQKYAIANNIGSTHTCESKLYNIRYKYLHNKESSNIVNLCAHDIAGYLGIIDHYKNNEKNIVPLQMSQFAIPSQETVNFYKKIENNLLIKDKTSKSKDKLRRPNKAEKEIALWGLVNKLGHDRTFYSSKSQDGKIKNYDWSVK